MNKKGVMTKVVEYVLAVIAFVAILTMLIPFTTSGFRLGVRETVCQMSLGFQKALPDIPLVDIPIAVCSTERLKINKDTFDDARTIKDDTVEEGGIRYILEKMRRCKSIVGIDEPSTWLQFWSRDKCYICYTLEMDEDIPVISSEELVDFALYRTPKGKKEVYFRDLQSPGHSQYYHALLFNANILPHKRYAIVYVDHSKPATWATYTKSASACALSLAPLLVPGIGHAVTATTFVVGCLGAGGYSTFTDILSTDTNKIMLTELETLINENDRQECSGYAY